MPSDHARVPLVDVIKAVASQLIIWHHLAFYGPLSDVVYPYAGPPLDWLYDHARIAVHAFLAAGGFLAARSLFNKSGLNLPRLLWRRYLRLALPYWVAVLAAIVFAAIARALIQHEAIPEAPTLAQVLAHVFFLQDILHIPALSAGVWYVAIDFQLYALLALFLVVARRWALALCIALTVASLFWFNRQPALDIWAPYFFGAYGLGILAEWISGQARKTRWVVLLGLLVAAALAVEWRPRMLVAGVTALTLAAASGYSPGWTTSQLVAMLGRISYPVFLIHYPVYVLTSAIVFHLWPTSPAANGLGMFTAWLLSLGAGWLLDRLVAGGFYRAPPQNKSV